jgi:CheY-like chemotaxis protein
LRDLAAVHEPVPETARLGDLIGDMPIEPADLAAIAEVPLTAAVGAALRAALEWLETRAQHPMRARADDAALEIVLEHVDHGGVRAAGEILAVVEGSLGRVESVRPEAPWLVRVPIYAARAQYLMLIEGDLPVAIPWHAVLHIVMARSTELEHGLAAPRISPLVAGTDAPPGAAEVPVVLVGHGLKRGYYVADRLVWRLPASPMETVSTPPAAGLARAVQTDEGEGFWVVDPGWLLREVEEPPPPPAPAEEPAWLGASDVVPLELTPREEALEVTPVPEEAPAPDETREPEPAPEPEVAPRVEVAPAPEPEVAPRVEVAPAPEAPPAPEARAEAPSGEAPPAEAPPAPPLAEPVPSPPAYTATLRAALIAEDSLTASIFLARLLEQQGFIVRTVETAAALGPELERGDWTLVCLDVELPDARGRGYLGAARAALERPRAGAPPVFIALVRDLEDAAEAQAAGIPLMLRKPYDRGALELMLEHAGIGAGGRH